MHSSQPEQRPSGKGAGAQASERDAETLMSVVLPCFNEEAVLPETHRRLVNVLEKIPNLGFELIYVDDGSRDATPDILRELQRLDAHVRIVVLSRNFGQQIALTAGLAEACGDVVAVLDADLQDPPEVLPEMLERWRRGADVAYGVRPERDGESVLKRWASKTFHRFNNRISEVSIPLDTGEFRLMDRRVVDAFLTMPERHRFLRGMIAWAGFRQEPIYFHRPPRAAGETKWRLSMMLRFAADGVFSFSLLPLRLAIWAGLIAVGLAVLGFGYAVALRLLTGAWVDGWALLCITIMLLGGGQFMFIGIVGEYVGRISNEVRQRPLYLVQERLGFPSPSPDERPRKGRRQATGRSADEWNSSTDMPPRSD